VKINLKQDKLINNTIWSLSGKIAAMLFTVLLDIIIARFLTVGEYAEWVYFFSILTMLFYIGWLGINASAKVYVSKTAGVTDRANCIGASLILRTGVSIAVGILIIIIMPLLSVHLGYPDKYPELKTLLQMSAFLVILNSFTEFFKEICIGLEKYKNLFLISVCEYGGYLLFSILTLCISHNVRSVAFGYMISGTGILFLGMGILQRDAGFRYSHMDTAYKEYIKPVLKYALPIAVIGLGSLVLIEMDTFMLGLFSTKAEVAAYSIVKNLCSKATHVNYALTVGTVTSLSVITAENFEEKKREFHKVYRVNLWITIIVSAALMLIGPAAILFLYGTKYAEAGIIIRLLVPYYAMQGISNFCSAFLDFRGKARLRSICYVSIIIINLLLNYLWIPLYGAKGAALATDLSLIPYTVFVIISSFRQFYKRNKQ